ncbi:histidine ammonia-lyase-like [Hydractinia symbiolongicarpus]|uniref:histidine ammonia-lyase-like n=1 Tax=Hydractinia symbiolongicarpus TaxID=13093 RepID=UPI00254FAE72|nr:histidine ammonia-lyase-like [Hydractinia symbiolongicarpus]
MTTPERCQKHPHESLQTLELNGHDLTTNDLVKCSKGLCKIKLSEQAKKNVEKSRDFLEQIIKSNKVVYAVNTGCGNFARVRIDNDKLKQLQQNIILSHAVCVGQSLSIERTRSLLALRINVLAKGFSGISLDNLQRIFAILNSGCVPLVPEKGTVGASGDLAPLSHLALGLMGEGQMWGPKTGWTDALTVLSMHGLSPIILGAKEGAACINGTQFITALGSEALERASAICRQADVVAALSLEVLKGTTKAFIKEIHDVRPHKGQKLVAARLRSLLHSDVYKSEVAGLSYKNKAPNAHFRHPPIPKGSTSDKIKRHMELFASLGKFFTFSMWAAKRHPENQRDNIFVTIDNFRRFHSTFFFSHSLDPLCDRKSGRVGVSLLRSHFIFYKINSIFTMSDGNFHGEYPAKALDYLAIGVHELSNMSERRIERLINPAYSELPVVAVFVNTAICLKFIYFISGPNFEILLKFLIPRLPSPKRVDAGSSLQLLIFSIRACALYCLLDFIYRFEKTQHLIINERLKIGSWNFRIKFSLFFLLFFLSLCKLSTGYRTLAACQGLKFFCPLKTTDPLEAVHQLVRSVVKPYNYDRYMKPDIEAAVKLLQEQKVWDTVQPYMNHYEKMCKKLAHELCDSSGPPTGYNCPLLPFSIK